MSTGECPKTYLDLSQKERNFFAITVAGSYFSTQECAAIVSKIKEQKSELPPRLRLDLLDAGYEMWQRHRGMVEQAGAAYGVYRDISALYGAARGTFNEVYEDLRQDYRDLVNSEGFRGVYNTLSGSNAKALLKATYEKYKWENGRRSHAKANYAAEKNSGGAFINYKRQRKVGKSSVRKRLSRRKK